MTTIAIAPPTPGNPPASHGLPADPSEYAPHRGDRPLYMIQGKINRMAFARWMRESDTDDPDAAAHRLLTESFGPAMSPRPYRIIEHRRDPEMPILGYTAADPDTLRRMVQACQDPLQAHTLDPDTIEGKEMPADWPAGLELAFELRARPITRTRSRADLHRCQEPARSILAAGAARHGAEYDVHRWEIIKYQTLGIPAKPPEEIYALWLSRMLAKTGAAALLGDRVKMLGMKHHPARRRRGGHAVPGMDVVMGGRIIIQKPEMFRTMLTRGLGRHIAYGHGMLLLRPPG